jgi:hypothetical protein
MAGVFVYVRHFLAVRIDGCADESFGIFENGNELGLISPMPPSDEGGGMT